MKTYKTADDDFSLSTFVKDSLLVTKKVLCIDDMKTNLRRRYEEILNDYPEHRKMLTKMIKDTSEHHCNSATSYYSSVMEKVKQGVSATTEYLMSGISFLYNIPSSSHAQRKGIDYEAVLKTTQKESTVFAKSKAEAPKGKYLQYLILLSFVRQL